MTETTTYVKQINSYNYCTECCYKYFVLVAHRLISYVFKLYIYKLKRNIIFNLRYFIFNSVKQLVYVE